jgi:predicted ATPase/tRNA A-37 threonylcarbamoyl transferase component Bud32
MRRCPTCERLYADEHTVCPDDGTALPPGDPLIGLVLDGKYRIDGVVGEGGMGTVYRSTQLNLHRPVAVKVIRGDFLEDSVATARFKREALAVAQVKHPHIVTVLDFGVTAEAGAYLVLEYLDGCTLRERIDCEGALPLPIAVALMRQVCSAVHMAHTAGIVHRDLKPENIFLEGTAAAPSAKVLDFGVAKVHGRKGAVAHGGAPKSLTISGVFVGTPTYMSPEQCEGHDLDARSDVYALGCVFYEMITGRPPFAARSLIALLNKHVSDPPVPPGALVPGLPHDIEFAVMRALAKLPEERHQSAAELAGSLGLESHSPRPDETLPTITGTFYRDTAQQLAAPTVREGAAATAPATPRHNLPSHVTSFIGRDREIAEVLSVLSTSRLVTLVGPGGMGKTRLSLQVALRSISEFRDGVWHVELATASDASTATKAVATALGVREETDRPLAGTLVSALATRHLLVILDNCEHVVGQCADLATSILGACPGVRLLASSQDVLGVSGENVRRIGALSTPPPETHETPDDMLRFESVRLFVERARLATPQFAVTEKNASHLAELCRRLEGIPLAVELAAARVRMLSVEQILTMTRDRFRLLTGGGRTAPLRHQTLRATMDWSHSLLADDEAILFRRLSVFVGGWTLDDAEAVVASELHPSAFVLHPSSILEILTRLVDRSLVAIDEGEATRFRMLETVRQYALEKVREAGEENAARDAHRAWCVVLAETESRNLRSDAESAWLDRLEAEHDNMRAALKWSSGDGRDDEAVARISAGLGWFWSTRGHWAESRKWFDVALASEASLPQHVRAKLLYWAAILDMNTGDVDRAKRQLDACLPLWRQIGDGQRTATTLYKLGELLASRGEYDAAIGLVEESLAISEALDDRRGVAYTVSVLGMIAMDRGDFDEAVRRYETCLGICRSIDDMRGVAGTLHNLGEIAGRRGDLATAEALLGESLAAAREFGYKPVAAASMQVLGNVANDRGNFARALEYFDEAMMVNRALGNQVGIAYVLEGIACSAAALGRPRRALRLYGSADRLREKIAAPLSPSEKAALERYLGRARTAIGDEEAQREIDEGRTMTGDEAIALALGAETPWKEPG